MSVIDFCYYYALVMAEAVQSVLQLMRYGYIYKFDDFLISNNSNHSTTDVEYDVYGT